MNKLKTKSVLIVDDENSNIMALTHILSSDYVVYASKNGQSAINVAEKYLPDVILLDILMPDMSGYEVITTLKSSKKTQHIPVIFITGLRTSGDEEKGLALGAADYIIKPFFPSIVKHRVWNQIKVLEQLNEYNLMQYKLASDALGIALWNIDVVNPDPTSPENKITWSQEFRQMFGFSDENDFPNNINALAERFHPEDSSKAFAAFAAHFNDYTGNTPYYIEYRVKHKNGEYMHVHGFGATQRDGKGIPLRTSGAVMDITEKQRMKVMLDLSPLACLVWDEKLNVVYCNKAAAKLFDLKDNQEIFNNFHNLSPSYQPDGQHSNEKLANYIKRSSEKGYYIFEWMHQMLDGTPLPTKITLFHVKDLGNYVFVGYIQDLREQQAAIEGCTG